MKHVIHRQQQCLIPKLRNDALHLIVTSSIWSHPPAAAAGQYIYPIQYMLCWRLLCCCCCGWHPNNLGNIPCATFLPNQKNKSNRSNNKTKETRSRRAELARRSIIQYRVRGLTQVSLIIIVRQHRPTCSFNTAVSQPSS